MPRVTGCKLALKIVSYYNIRPIITLVKHYSTFLRSNLIKFSRFSSKPVELCVRMAIVLFDQLYIKRVATMVVRNNNVYAAH